MEAGDVGRVASGWCSMPVPALLTVSDLADDAVVQIADERGAERPRPLVAGGALAGLVPGCSAW